MRSAPGSVLSHTANCSASFWCFVPVTTAVVEPPQKPVVASPLCHAGIGAMAHLPRVLGAMPSSTAGDQAAPSQATIVPLPSPLFHCGVQLGPPSTRPWLTRLPQKVATRLVAASLMDTCQVSPEVDHQLAPAWPARPANQPGSTAEKLVRNAFGAFCLSFLAVAANWGQVDGTVRPYLRKRSCR